VPSEVALFFLLFAGPSTVLALLASREFFHRGVPPDERRLRRAGGFLILAASLAALLVLLTALGTGGAPLRSQRGWGFVGYGLVAGALGPLGAWLFRRAAANPRRRLVKAAETVPFLLVVLNVSVVVNAWAQA
jgi:hypothetical protein